MRTVGPSSAFTIATSPRVVSTCLRSASTRSSNPTPPPTRSCAPSPSVADRREDLSQTRPLLVAARVGRLVTVGGPPGVGRTEIAIELALALGRTAGVVLVDADDVGPAVAARLDLPIEPNLRTAIDAVEHGRGAARSLRGRRTRFAAAGRVRHPQCERVGAGAARRDRSGRRPAGRRRTDRCGRRRGNVGGHRRRHGAGALRGGPRARGGSRRSRCRMRRIAARLGSVSRVGGRGARARAGDGVRRRGRIAHPARSSGGASSTRRSRRACLQSTSCSSRPIDRVGDAAWNGTPVTRGPFTRAVALVAAQVSASVATGPRRSADIAAFEAAS